MVYPTLAESQREFMNLLFDDTRAIPDGWREDRVAIYRNAYRARTVDALRETYPRTERWIGEPAFARAAIHHIIQRPPDSWTLDAVGNGMSDTLRALFQKDPEVSELAWLEWAMLRCFVSADGEPIDAAGFQAATAGYRDADWAELCLSFLPGTQVKTVSYRIDRLWRTLLSADEPSNLSALDYRASEPLACVVWRQGMTPVCAAISASEGRTLAQMLEGASYGAACDGLATELGAETTAAEAGAMLGRWIHNGMLAA